MSHHSRVKVCILSFNRPAYLLEAIHSVLSQSLQPDEIRILDNASTEDVYSVVAQIPGIVWDPSPVNIGGIRNILRALSVSDTDYLFVMHDDDRILPDFLSKMVSFMDENPDVVASTCHAHAIDQNGNRTLRNLKKEIASPRLFSSPVELAYYLTDNFLFFPSVLYRSPCYRNIQIEDLYLDKVSDLLIYFNLIKCGKIAELPDRLLEYRVHQGQDSLYFPDELLHQVEEYYLKIAKENPISSYSRKIVSGVKCRRTIRMLLHVIHFEFGDAFRLFRIYPISELCLQAPLILMGRFIRQKIAPFFQGAG